MLRSKKIIKDFFSKIEARYRNFLFFRKLKATTEPVVFFIPYHRFGGSETVHKEIISIAGSRAFVVYTFSSGGFNIDSADNPRNFLFCPGIEPHSKDGKKLIDCLNKNTHPIFLGSNSVSFYHFLPFLSAHVARIDLIHALSFPDSGIEDLAIEYSAHIMNRVCISESIRKGMMKKALKAGIPEKRMPAMKVIHNSLDYAGFTTNNPDILLDRSAVGFVGRASKEKRPEVFKGIAEAAMQVLPGWTFHMFGTYNKAITEGNITYYPPTSDVGEVVNWMNKTLTILVVCSYREGFPMVISEAAYAGIPVLSTAVGSVPDFIDHGHNGWLVPLDFEKETTITQLANSLQHIVNSRAEFQKVAENCHEIVTKHFRPEIFKQDWTEMLAYPKTFKKLR